MLHRNCNQEPPPVTSLLSLRAPATSAKTPMGSALFSTIATSVDSLGVPSAKADLGAPMLEEQDGAKKPPRNDKKRKRKRKKVAGTRSSPSSSKAASRGSASTYEETRARYPLLVAAVETPAAAGELGLPPHVRGHRLLLEPVGEDYARRLEHKLKVDELVKGKVELRRRRLTVTLKEALVKACRREPNLEPIPEEEENDADSHDDKMRKEEAERISSPAASDAAEECGRARQYEEMRARYPLLVAEVDALAAAGELVLPPHVPGHHRLLELIAGANAWRLEGKLKKDALMKVKANLHCRGLTVNLIFALIKAEEKHG